MKSVIIRGKLPSLNEYVRACRSSPQAGGGFCKRVERWIVPQLARLDRITSPVIISFEWHEMTQRRDKDNVAFAKKFILDAMQYAGKLPNDNNRYIKGFGGDDFVYGDYQGVKVTIERVI